jgi:ABC-type branched-subunit amino acid transport system substrate-binding protein/uncharacterized protein YgiM (DUF1202 family)
MKPLQILVRQRTPRRWAAAAVILIALLAAGMTVPLTLAAPGQQVANVLSIGYLGVRGSQTANGAELAIEQINQSGGVSVSGTAYQLQLVALDSEPTVDTLGDAIGQLVAQNVVAILGPDSNALITPDNIQALASSGRPVLTAATGDALTDYDETNYIFRTRAPERIYSYALATYLTTDLGLTQIAAVQTEVEFTEALMHFETSLSNVGVSLAAKIVLPGGETLATDADQLITLNPQAVVMWGSYNDAALLLSTLRTAGWQGVFAYRKANEAIQANILPRTLADGVLGMDSWSYGDSLSAAKIFLRDYVVAFGEIPGPLSVAAYDAVWFLRFAVVEKGITPAAIQEGLLAGNPRTLVQGVLHPIEFSNGDLSRTGVIYKIGPRGGSSVVARFDDISRLQLDQAGATPEATPVPAATPLPPTSSVPTATLEGTWVSVNVDTLNIRIGPGPNYDIMGKASKDDLFRVLGAIGDYTWVAIEYQGQVGWVKTEFVTVLGSLTTVNIVQPPPTPTLAATLTPSLPPNPDLVIDAVTLDQPQPTPGKSFTATVTVRNGGAGAVGRFAVAATWAPGDVYTATFVEGLAGGQSTQAYLTATVNGTGTFQIGIVADLNNDIPETNEGNNSYNITYRVDYPLFVNQSNVQLNATTDYDLYGGTVDFQWDGTNLAMRNGSQIGVLSGVTYENVHYGLLEPGVVNNTVGLSAGQVLAGGVYGFYTAEGRRAVIRVDNLVGTQIWISYRVYNNTP